MKELNLVVLTHDIEAHGLETGDVGAVVHCYDNKVGFEVEFVTAEGKTVAVLTLTTKNIRPFDGGGKFLTARVLDSPKRLQSTELHSAPTYPLPVKNYHYPHRCSGFFRLNFMWLYLSF